MTIRFRAAAVPQVAVPGHLDKTASGHCGHPGPRAAFQQGTFYQWCFPCLDAFRKAIAAWKARTNPLWFLGAKRSGKETKRP